MLRAAQKSLAGFCAALFLCLQTWVPAAAADSNSCVACHRTITGVNYLEHDFKDWEQSVHAKAGLTCDACHGGDPAAKEMAQAHKGVKPSMDASSPVYFNRIPATCGACHQAEYKAFQKSKHYHELETSGKGPNCVSCHGSMANHILSPRDLEASCSLCHQQPTQASATMMALNHAGASVKRLETALAGARAAHVDVLAQDQTYHDLQALHQRALEDWHTFKMAQVLNTSQEITKRVNVALNELKLKQQQKKP